jgi:hypothetical protein
LEQSANYAGSRDSSSRLRLNRFAAERMMARRSDFLPAGVQMPAMLPMIVALLAQAATPSQPEATTAPASRKPIVVEGNRRTCTTIVATGSILPRTVCKTAAEWEQDRAASKRLIDQRAREQTTYLQILDAERRPRQSN